MLDNLRRYPRKVLLDPLARILSRRALHRFMQASDLDSIVDVPVRYRGRGFYGGIGYIQRRSEILDLARAIQKGRPKVIVEIGSFQGGTLYVFCRSNPQAELVVSIDLPGGPFGGGCSSRQARFFREFVHDRPHTQIETIREDSKSEHAVRRLQAILAGRQIDFLYIDADHTYQGVSGDFETYSQFMRPGGHIAFHDILSRDPEYGVPALWAQLSARYPSVEFRDGPDSIMGIGMLTYTGAYDGSDRDSSFSDKA